MPVTPVVRALGKKADKQSWQAHVMNPIDQLS